MLGKLLAGRYGLARTFWLFGVLGGALFGLPIDLLAAAGREHLAVVAILLAITWAVVVLIAVWRASRLYRGPVIWGLLARCVFVLGTLWLVRDLVVAIA